MSIAELESAVASLDAQIEAATRERHKFNARLMDAKSKMAVSLLGVTKGNTVYDGADGVPWFGHVEKFVDWLKKNHDGKSFATWNGQIHFVHKLIIGRFEPTDARWEDVH